jgi:thiamine biosynthesis lipoprotein
MGTQVELLTVSAPSGALAAAQRRLAELEARWSRFLPDSELSTLNRAAGRAVAVSSETLTLVALAVLGWRATAGRFDPTVLDALEAAGYDRSFDQLPAGRHDADGARPAPGPAPGLAGIRIDAEAGTLTLPPGTRLDLGGIAKGYAADLLCAQLRAAGAAGACVNVGGDLRVSGTAPTAAHGRSPSPTPTAARRPPSSSPRAPPPPAPPCGGPGRPAAGRPITSSTRAPANLQPPASFRSP